MCLTLESKCFYRWWSNHVPRFRFPDGIRKEPGVDILVQKLIFRSRFNQSPQCPVYVSPRPHDRLSRRDDCLRLPLHPACSRLHFFPDDFPQGVVVSSDRRRPRVFQVHHFAHADCSCNCKFEESHDCDNLLDMLINSDDVKVQRRSAAQMGAQT